MMKFISLNYTRLQKVEYLLNLNSDLYEISNFCLMDSNENPCIVTCKIVVNVLTRHKMRTHAMKCMHLR